MMTGRAAPMRKKYSIGLYKAPPVKSFAGPIRPQKIMVS